MNMPLEQLISAHAYGVINGLFIASFVYTLFLALFHLFTRKQKRVGLTFLLFSLGFASFCLFNLFYQQINSSIIVHILPSYLTTISKFGAPIGLGVFSFVFFRIVSLHSYQAYQLYKKYDTAFKTLIFLDILCIIALYFIQELKVALLILIALALCHLVVVIWFAFNGLKTRAAKISALLFGVLFLLALVLTFSVYTGDISLSHQANLYVHLVTSLVLLITSFISIRYSMREAERYFSVRKLDEKNLVDDLFKALNKREFYLVYQPKIDLKNNTLNGAEALIRWQHPKHGVISPADFIPLAEKTGLIINLCQWLIKETLKQQQTFIMQGLDLPISVNFSVKNVDARMVQFLIKNLEKYDIPADKLIIEITESLFLDFNEKVTQALKMLEGANIKLSLDDYGTGFSSLNYLQRTSPDELKIDRSFIMNLSNNADSRAIVRSVMQMSKELNISVVAEGVETEDTVSLLRDLGCDTMQGYLVAKPMTAEAFEDWLADPNNQYI